MRKYTEEDYFNFLYDLAFTSEDYISLAKLLHNMDFEWVLRLDENRADDGIEIRKYYLADKNGYLPDTIDVDDYIREVMFINQLESEEIPFGGRDIIVPYYISPQYS